MELVAPLPFPQGKDLIVNNLASSLWHRHCFSATTWSFESGAVPSGEMCLVWSALALCSSLVSSHGRGGGQGLIEVLSRTEALRLQMTQRLLNGCGY